jgi:RimJ/RimL family protein N-acetyltransferase
MWEGLAARLEGRLVTLEPLAPEHGPGLYEAGADPEVWRWMPVHATASPEAFSAWLEDAIARTDAGLEVAFATIDRASERPIGSTRYLTLRPEHRGLEIGWTWLASQAWSGGSNVEAKLLMLEHAFERHGCMRVEFKTNALNERSRRALEALPARFEGVFRKHMLVQRGEVRDSAYYSVTDDEWPEVRANLERRLKGATGSILSL